MKRSCLTCGILFAGFCVFVVLSMIYMPSYWSMRPSSGYWANYPDMAFQGNKDFFYVFYTGGEHRNYRMANVWIKLKDGEVIELAKLPEEMADAWDIQRDATRFPGGNEVHQPNGRTIKVYKIGYLSHLFYVDGKLNSCAISDIPNSPYEGIQIGSSASGEFLSFPIRREDLIRVFGKPDKIGLAVKPMGF